ncbi:MAG: TIR domain-containing protein [Anaerolineae bacterium]|nr:TIR domain-containing protein [Anaerolineae bacterium]
MSKIFISYSRIDRNFVDDFVPLLREVYGKNDVWVDDELHGGQVWWDEILRQIANCDVFIYLLSNESLESSYCQAEYQEALRLNKLILPVQIRSRTRIPPELSKVQFVDLSSGVKDSRGMTHLYASIGQLVANAPTQPITPRSPTPIPVPDITLTIKHPPPNRLSPGLLVGSIVMLVLIVAIALIVTSQNPPITSTTPATTQAALNPTDSPETAAPTNTLSETEVESTVQSEMFSIQTEAAQTIAAQETATFAMQTAFAQQTVYAVATADANATATATLWTLTPTPDARQTAEFRLSETRAAEIEQATAAAIASATQYALDQTATVNALIRLAESSVQHNADWRLYSQTFNGIQMMLVPAGCFDMGSNDGNIDEKPVEEFCFDAPFWIDRTEVTQADSPV